MRIEGQFRQLPDRFDDERTEREIRHEVAVHHVEMEPVGTALGHRADLVHEVSEVGREEGRSDLDQERDCIGSSATVVKRALVPIALLAAAFGALLFWGRAPSRYVLETKTAEFQQERREAYVHFTREIARAALAKAPTQPLRAELDARVLRAHEQRLGGWHVAFVPPGAKPPGPGYARWGKIDPTARGDATAIAGAWRVWMKPLTRTARLADACGVGP
jgi:hypothetical protein